MKKLASPALVTILAVLGAGSFTKANGQEADWTPRQLIASGDNPAFNLMGSRDDREQFLTMIDRCGSENEWFHDRLWSLATIKAGVRLALGRDLEKDLVIIGKATPTIHHLDLADVEAFPPYEQADGDWEMPPNAPKWASRHCGIILHELIEAFWMQRHGYSFDRAHQKGLQAENTVGYGYGRLEGRTDTSIVPVDNRTEFVVIVGTICEPDKYEERFNITGFAKLSRPTYRKTGKPAEC